MKHLIIFLLIVIVSFQLFSQKALTSKANIEEVTVYLYGAEVKAKSSINLPKGRGMYEIHNISPQAINNSVQISNGQDIEILSVSVLDYSDDAEKRFPEIKRMNDSVKIISNKITAYNNEKSSFEAEKDHLVKNLYIGGTNVGVNITDMKAASTYYRERTLAIKQEITKIDALINIENEKLNNIYTRKNKLLSENNMNYKKIIIEYETEVAVNANFAISYIAGKCGWAPTYDLKAKEIGEPVVIKYKAKVFNNTGIAWSSVKMKLSTGDPLQGASAPTISTWDLNYNSPGQSKGGYYDNTIKNEYRQFETEQYVVMDEKVSYNTVAVSEISVEFEIAKQYNIPADGKPYTIDVTEYSLNADFSYYAIPKFESYVYLIGKITGWESLSLIDGDMNVYFDETYLGVSKLNTSSLNDTLELSFGRDKQISIKRNRIEEYSKKSLLGNSRKESYQYDIFVKNNRKVDITICIVDQVPISRESEIEVTVGELSGADYNPVTGKTTWTTTLKPTESKKYTFGYSIKYPKNQTVNTKQYRSLSCPQF